MTDYTVADTIHIMFSTRAFATGTPTTLAGTPVVSAYEDDSVTQITAGITLGVDHDSVTGLNLLTIVATGANGYESGKDYNLVITTGTVGGVSVVGEVVGRFTLGRSADWTTDEKNQLRHRFGIDGTAAAPIAPAAGTPSLLKVAMVEAYAAKGVVPTPEEALQMVLQTLIDFSISGVTVTVNKRDGVATAFTIQLNDAVNPTASLQAT